MATTWQTYPLNFQGGLITNLGLLDHGTQFPGSARRLLNFEVTNNGAGYKKILGYRNWASGAIPGSTSVKVHGAILPDPATALAVRGDRVYKAPAQGAWADIFTLDTTAAHRVRHASYDFGQGEQVVMVDGANSPYYYDVTLGTVSQPTLGVSGADVEGASFVAVFADRLFFANGPIVTYSNLLTSGSFDPALGAGNFKVESNVTGLIVFRDQLIIFGEDRIDYLTGTSEADFQVKPITRKTGCPWPDSIQEVGGDILYKGPDGIRYLSATQKIDDFALERASESIQADITQTFVDALDVASFVVRTKAQYRVFYYDESLTPSGQKGFVATRFADQTSSDIAWGILSGFKVYAADSKQFGAEEVIIFTDGEANMYEAEWGFSFDGEDIPCLFETPFLFFEDPRVRKTFYKHHVYMRAEGAYDISTQLRLDFGDSRVIQPPQQSFAFGTADASLYGSAVYGVSTYATPQRIALSENLVGSGFSMSLTYSDQSQNPSFTISSAVLEFAYNDRK